MSCEQGLTCIRYGGIYERGAREYTLDDFYSLQLDKLDKFVCLKESAVVPKEGQEDESEDDDEDDDEDGDGSSSDEDDLEDELEADTLGKEDEEEEKISDEDQKVRTFQTFPRNSTLA